MIFEDEKIDLKDITCHSGGALGADTYWEQLGEPFGVKTNAYSYKTSYHTGKNKVEISDEDYQQGVDEINKANRVLCRYGISKYMSLLARNWSQVKYSTQIFAIGYIIDPGVKSPKGFYSKSKYQIVDGGTGYAVQMGINNEREVFVFDQVRDKWFRWSYSTLQFVEIKDTPVITNNDFAGIGTRELEPNGLKAIRDIYEKSLKNK